MKLDSDAKFKDKSPSKDAFMLSFNYSFVCA